MKSLVKYLLTFSRGERNGIILLLALAALLVVAPEIYRAMLKPVPSNAPEFYARVDSFFNSLTLNSRSVEDGPSHSVLHEELTIAAEAEPFYFDPNHVSADDMVKLGLSTRQAQTVINYRAKGGRFRSPEDFAKVYVIDSSTYHRLKPWIRIHVDERAIAPATDAAQKPEDAEPAPVDINTADTLELTRIRGIGRVYARRIVAYRELLGGFHSLHQLTEVYGVKGELVSSIAGQVRVDSTRVKRMNLNMVTYDELRKHPYISDYQSKAIIYYRSRRGAIKSLDEIVENKLVPPETFNKIKNYLTLQ
jgi:competence ComEA-like helix-hairpin-helix protein